MLHILAYFESLIKSSQFANFVLESDFLLLLLNLLQSYQVPNLRLKIASILANLIRFSTEVDQVFYSSGIQQVLIE